MAVAGKLLDSEGKCLAIAGKLLVSQGKYLAITGKLLAGCGKYYLVLKKIKKPLTVISFETNLRNIDPVNSKFYEKLFFA